MKTSRYFILPLLSSFLLFLVIAPVLGQTTQNTDRNVNQNQNQEQSRDNKTPVIIYPFFNGISVGVDVFGIGNKLIGGDYLSTEVSVEANIKNRFLPIVELGYGTTDTWSEDNRIHYKGSSPYFKLGMNYNTMYKKDNKGYLYVGVRYAFSPLTFDVQSVGTDNGTSVNPSLSDPVWGVGTPPFDHQGLKANMHWFEFVAGVKVHIFSQLYMGWSVRMKYRIKASLSEYGNPWYVPGFGEYGSSRMGLTYSIIYHLPF